MVCLIYVSEFAIKAVKILYILVNALRQLQARTTEKCPSDVILRPWKKHINTLSCNDLVHMHSYFKTCLNHKLDRPFRVC